jgi:tripartite ATP-independent transporter DctM subunit
VIYGMMGNVSIGALFLGGVIPGLVMTAFMMGYVYYCARKYGMGRDQAFRWRTLGVTFIAAFPALLTPAIIVGGMTFGWFTPTEAAGIGAMGGFLFALARGTLTVPVLVDILVQSARTSAMLFTILIGASIFASFANFTTMPQDLKDFVEQFQINPILVIVAICAVYVILGTAMEELSMILLTVPIFFPLVTHLGFDPIWFGILIVCVVEIGMISPPVGMNVFVLRSVLPDVPTGQIWKGVMPFLYADILRLAVLVAFPAITLWLPKALGLT